MKYFAIFLAMTIAGTMGFVSENTVTKEDIPTEFIEFKDPIIIQPN